MTSHYDCQFHWSKSSLCSSHVNDARYTILASFRSWDSRPLFLSPSLVRLFFTSEYSPKDDLAKENFFNVNHRLLFCYRWGRRFPPFLRDSATVHLSFYIPKWSIFTPTLCTILKKISYHSRHLSWRYLAANGTRDSEFGMTSAVKERAAQQHQSSQYSHMARRIGSDKCRNNLH